MKSRLIRLPLKTLRNTKFPNLKFSKNTTWALVETIYLDTSTGKLGSWGLRRLSLFLNKILSSKSNFPINRIKLNSSSFEITSSGANQISWENDWRTFLNIQFHHFTNKVVTPTIYWRIFQYATSLKKEWPPFSDLRVHQLADTFNQFAIPSKFPI